MTFFEIAKPMALLGEPQILVGANTKVAKQSDWPNLATTDLDILAGWSAENPDANAACVAKAQIGGFWFFEVDDQSAIQRMQQETGQQLTGHFMVRSSPGRGHFHFKQTPASIKMGNVAQVRGLEWSARVNDQYVLTPGSLHPRTGLPYEIVSDVPIQEAPDWLIDWCLKQKEAKPVPKPQEAPEQYPEGSRNNSLTSYGGRLRNTGLIESEIYTVLSRTNQEKCNPPLSDQEVQTISGSVARYEYNEERPVIVGSTAVATTVVPELEDLPIFKKLNHPKFPAWIMEGTSIYENLVKPICAVNSRYPEFGWLPTTIMMLNYLGTKIEVKDKDFKGNLFCVLIGRKGRVIKSSSVEDGIKFLNLCGILDHAGRGSATANGRSLVWKAGSAEGLGLEMQKKNCMNAILFYDELADLVKKAGIDSSSLSSTLLTMYESGKFENTIKSKKESFSLDPGSYCASLIACTTDKNFQPLWSKLSGESSGLDDRFFFLYQPEKLIDPTPRIVVSTAPGAVNTRRLIDKAVLQKTFHFVDQASLIPLYKKENRYGIRAEKFALGFAVDLGRTEIDEDCVERAVALVEYEVQVKEFLKTYEATTREGGIQQQILHTLSQHGGLMSLRDLERKMHAPRLGTFLWSSSFRGLLGAGYVREYGSGVKADPKMIQQIRLIETDEDE